MDGTTPLGVDEHIDPAHKHPERALCAAGGFYPPLQLACAYTEHSTEILRFLSGNEPGGLGQYRIGIRPVASLKN